jgi:hypothetical protein
MRDLERHTAWQCPRCHEHVTTPTATLGYAHWCPRSLSVENFTPAWAVDLAVERQTKAVRTLRAVA